MSDKVVDHRKRVSPVWVVLTVAGAATAALLTYKKVRDASPEDISRIMDIAEKAAQTLDDRLCCDFKLAS